MNEYGLFWRKGIDKRKSSSRINLHSPDNPQLSIALSYNYHFQSLPGITKTSKWKERRGMEKIRDETSLKHILKKGKFMAILGWRQ